MTRKPSQPHPALNRRGERLMKDGKPGWSCKVWDARKGGQREKTFYGTEREAHAFIAKQREQVKAATTPVLPRAQYVTVGQWSLEWLRKYRWKVEPIDGEGGVPRPETTWKNAKANVSAYIVPNLGENTRMVTVKADDLKTLVTKLKVTDHAKKGKPKTKPADADTKDKCASIIRIMFAAAKEAGVLEQDPAAKLRTVWGEQARAGRVVIPSLVQVETLACALDAAWPGRGDIARVFAYTALRWENLSALRWDDIDFEMRSIHVWQSRPSSTGKLVPGTKGGDDYFITLLDEAVEPLRRLEKFAADRGSEWVIIGERGGPLSYGLWRKHLDPVRKKTGVPYTAHQLRHVAVSLLIAGGASIERVREQAAHKSTAVTERVYRHAFNIDRRELARQLRLPATTVTVDESAEK